jgi:hypothetical protein
MADKATKEQVYATLGKRLAGELKEHTGHIDGFYRQPWGKTISCGLLIHREISNAWENPASLLFHRHCLGG